jgi:hypothetical protein
MSLFRLRIDNDDFKFWDIAKERLILLIMKGTLRIDKSNLIFKFPQPFLGITKIHLKVL